MHLSRLSLLLAVCLPSLASAQGIASVMTRTASGGYDATTVGATVSVGSITSTPVTGVWNLPAGAATGTAVGGFGFDAPSGTPRANTRAEMPIPGGGGRTVPINVTAPISKAAAATAIATNLGKAIPIAGNLASLALAAAAAYELAKSLGFDADPETKTLVKVTPPVAEGWMYFSPVAPQPTLEAACQANAQYYGTVAGSAWTYDSWSLNGTSCGMRIKGVGSNAGNYHTTSVTLVWKAGQTGTSSAATTQQLADAIASQSGWPSKATEALAEAVKAGEPVQVGAPTVSGPASVAGPVTKTSEPVNDPTKGAGTKTTTSTTTYNNTYNNNTYNTTTNTTRTSVTTYANGSASTTETKTEETKPEPEATPVRDTALPAMPKLYEPKYPDGPAGVWTTQLALIKETPLFQLPAQLAPNLGTGGGCPTWSMGVNVGIANFGSHSTSIPCNVWTFMKWCVLLGALWLARKLVFGG